jgi:hypothetical protein
MAARVIPVMLPLLFTGLPGWSSWTLRWLPFS